MCQPQAVCGQVSSHDVTKAPLVATFVFSANNDCSYGVHWFVLGVVVEPAMHVCLWYAKGSELYMRPLIQQLCDKGIPLTAKP